MRPDQHKKKKNSDYKKKHGISSDKGEKHDEKGLKLKGQLLRSEQVSGHSGGAGFIDDGQLGVEHQTNSEGRNFSKRKIESNWDRYEEDNFDGDFEESGASSVSSQSIGADYQSLLDKATSTNSHFLFNNEKNWENINDDESNSKAGLSLMSIDCHSLAQSLKNIPLEQRLEIDQKYFNKDDCWSNTNKNKMPVRNCGDYDQEIMNEKSNKSLKPTVYEKENPAVVHKPKTVEESKYQHLIDKPCSTQVKNNRAALYQQDRNVNIHYNTESALEKDEVELLLEGDNDKEQYSAHQEKLNEVRESINTTEVDGKKSTPVNTKEDLEDWLDSILD